MVLLYIAVLMHTYRGSKNTWLTRVVAVFLMSNIGQIGWAEMGT